ncbi:MAG: signal peptide peptidase SppA, partial [Bacteroidota bacterium]
MRSFFKIFFASLLALIVFIFIGIFLLFAIAASVTSKDAPQVAANSVLVIDLSEALPEMPVANPFDIISDEEKPVSLTHALRLIEHAKTNEKIKGIYIIANNSALGFAGSNEMRNAIVDFKKSKKWVIAYGDVMTQQAYFVAGAANKVYVNPAGAFDWMGYSVTLPFLKGTLDKLEIEPQIFYAGKFKSATEIFRTEKMTPENRLQTMEWLGDMYQYFLVQTAQSRGVDTAALHALANTATIQTPQDAVAAKLIDGAKYDDEVKAEMKKNLGVDKTGKFNTFSLSTYNDAVNLRTGKPDRIALILAEGDIVDGEGSDDNIGGDKFRKLIRKARLDKSVKAIVMRVNSGGGSALASENIWRELQLAKQDGKPVVVSFGDVAASGGYYIAAGADSIFANPNTITGSIGVFGIIPNMQAFYKNKLGITFDGVNTATYADAGGTHRAMNEAEKKIIQASIDRIYLQFKQRVADGRKKNIALVDSIAQGRVWSGEDALRLGLVDKFGNLQDALNSAARMAKMKEYSIREYPEQKNWLQSLINKNKPEPEAMIKKEVGEENFRMYQQMKKIKEITGSVQARLPFEFIIR